MKLYHGTNIDFSEVLLSKYRALFAKRRLYLRLSERIAGMMAPVHKLDSLYVVKEIEYDYNRKSDL